MPSLTLGKALNPFRVPLIVANIGTTRMSSTSIKVYESVGIDSNTAQNLSKVTSYLRRLESNRLYQMVGANLLIPNLQIASSTINKVLNTSESQIISTTMARTYTEVNKYAYKGILSRIKYLTYLQTGAIPNMPAGYISNSVVVRKVRTIGTDSINSANILKTLGNILGVTTGSSLGMKEVQIEIPTNVGRVLRNPNLSLPTNAQFSEKHKDHNEGEGSNQKAYFESKLLPNRDIKYGKRDRVEVVDSKTNKRINKPLSELMEVAPYEVDMSNPSMTKMKEDYSEAGGGLKYYTTYAKCKDLDLGDNSRWSIHIYSTTYSGKPNLMTTDNSRLRMLNMKPLILPNFGINEWLPITDFSFDKYNVDTSTVTAGIFSIDLPTRITGPTTLKVTVLDDFRQRIQSWLDAYARFIYDIKTNTTVPYLNRLFGIDIYQFDRTFSLIYSKKFLGVLKPNTDSFSGESDATPIEHQLEFTLVGEDSESVVDYTGNKLYNK